jgi:hypothetical protein
MWIRSIVWCGLPGSIRPCGKTLFNPISFCHNRPENLDMIQLEIKIAFLYGDLQEEIYMTQPEGYFITGKEDYVCRLLKPIYGLKQGSRCWYTKFNEAFLLLRFTRCLHDPCLYSRSTVKGEYTIMVIYVDDGLVSSNIPGVLTKIIEFLKTHF